jgi:CIC family chloride channel protein
LQADLARVVAYAVNGLFVGWSPIFLFSNTIHFTQPIALIGYATLGIIAGVIGAIEPPIFYGMRDLFRSLKIPNHVKPAIGGLLMGLLAVIVPETISTGYGWVQKAMTGATLAGPLYFSLLQKSSLCRLRFLPVAQAVSLAPTLISEEWLARGSLLPWID